MVENSINVCQKQKLNQSNLITDVANSVKNDLYIFVFIL